MNHAKKGFVERGGALMVYLLAALAASLVLFFAVVLDAGAQTACPTGAVPTDSVRVCWRNATEFESGAAIPATGDDALATTEVQKGACTATAAPTATETFRVTSDVGFMLWDAQPPGWVCLRARHVTTRGTLGIWTAWARKELKTPAPPKPKAPTLTIA